MVWCLLGIASWIHRKTRLSENQQKYMTVIFYSLLTIGNVFELSKYKTFSFPPSSSSIFSSPFRLVSFVLDLISVIEGLGLLVDARHSNYMVPDITNWFLGKPHNFVNGENPISLQAPVDHRSGGTSPHPLPPSSSYPTSPLDACNRVDPMLFH